MTAWGRDSSDYDTNEDVSGLDFATNKVTEGTTIVHSSYARRLPVWRQMVPVVGAYHVLRTPGSGSNGSLSSQLDFWYSHMDASTPWRHDVPFIEQLDIERWPYDAVSVIRKAGRPLFHREAVALLEPSHVADLTAQRASTTLDFCQLWQASGSSACKVIYASRGQYGDGLSGAPFDFWNAHYVGAYPGDQSADWNPYSGTVKFLQYTSTPYDKDAFRGSRQDLLDYVGGFNVALQDDVTSIKNDMVFLRARIEAMAHMYEKIRVGSGSPEEGDPVEFVQALEAIKTAVTTPAQFTLAPKQLTQLEAALGPAVHAELAKIGITLTVAP